MASGVVVQLSHFWVWLDTVVVVFGIGVKENRAGCPPDEAGLAKE